MTESSSPIIHNTLELSKHLHKEAKTSWFTGKVKISELIHNLNETYFNSQIEHWKNLSKIAINAWYTKKETIIARAN